MAKRSFQHRSFMFYVLFGGTTGLIPGLFVLHAFPVCDERFTLITSILVGVSVATLIWMSERSTRSINSDIPTERCKGPFDAISRGADEPPLPIERRLSRFLNINEDEIGADRCSFRSRTPFWSRVSFTSRVGPKSLKYIRIILERIRRTIRGN